jgi:hypothetical protein
MSKDFFVVGLRLDDGKISPLAWAETDLTKRELRRVAKAHRKDADVIGGWCLPYWRLYDTPTEMKKELPKLT